MQEVATQLKAAQAGPIVVPLDRAVALATVERVREGLRNGMASDGERGEVLRAFNDNSRWDRERAVWRWTLARAGAVVYQES
jgi:hypothetical protein